MNVEAVHGIVDKVDGDTLVITPRLADGKYGKAISLAITGTSKIHSLQPQMRSGKAVMTQVAVEAKDVKVKQRIAVIYTQGPGSVLLVAVVQPVSDKNGPAKK